jgi:hypothetical protein
MRRQSAENLLKGRFLWGDMGVLLLWQFGRVAILSTFREGGFLRTFW